MTNVDINGIVRGICSECDCREFLSGERVRCATCGHAPNKHSVVPGDTAKAVAHSNFAPKRVETQDNFQSLTNATFDIIDNTSYSNSNPFESNFPPTDSPKLVLLDTDYGLAASGQDDRSTDARGVLRGPCSQCSCEMYQRPSMGVKCSICAHPPTRHSTGPVSSQTQSFPLSEPIDFVNSPESRSHSKVSAKVDISPVSLQNVTTASSSHRVMTSFRSDPPDVVTVSADNSLIVPADQAVKITIEINVIPTPI